MIYPSVWGNGLRNFFRRFENGLETAETYAAQHTEASQRRYVHYHNLRTREKKFVVGQKCLILQPDDTSSRTFSRWKGPAEVVEVKSPHSYIVELDGKQMHIHANYLRPFHVRVDEVKCNCSELQSVIDNCFSCLLYHL
mgnify:CR=1 FL=1